MEITNQANHLLAKAAAEVQAYFTDFSDLAHGYEHVQRVYHLALRLAEQEQADSFIVGMAALLHDLGRTTRGPARSHAKRSASLAKKLLASYGLSHDTQREILQAVLTHSYGHGPDPMTLEARVLYDADRLDSLGASGVVRWAMTTKRVRWPATSTYHPEDPFALWRVPDEQYYLLDRFFTKLLPLQGAMLTAAGRAMAERRTAFMRLFLQEIQQELAEGRYGNNMPEDSMYHLLWVEKWEEEPKEKPAGDLQSSKIVEIHRIHDSQHLASGTP